MSYMEYIRTDIKHLIHRTKQTLADNDRKYYPELADVEFTIYSYSRDTLIHVFTDASNFQYFIDTFRMQAGDDYLRINLHLDTNNYWTLYYNALIVMLEQSLNDPRAIICGCYGWLTYKNPAVDGDEVDKIKYHPDLGNTFTELFDQTEITHPSSTDEYIKLVKDKWTGINSAYNIYRYEGDLEFDTYPSI